MCSLCQRSRISHTHTHTHTETHLFDMHRHVFALLAKKVHTHTHVCVFVSTPALRRLPLVESFDSISKPWFPLTRFDALSLSLSLLWRQPWGTRKSLRHSEFLISVFHSRSLIFVLLPLYIFFQLGQDSGLNRPCA